MARASFDTQELVFNYDTIKPVWSISYEDKATLLEWVGQAFDMLLEDSRERIQTARENIARYRGVYPQAEPVIGGRDLPMRNRAHPRIVMNHYKDLIDQKVTSIVKQKSQTSVVPASDNIDDKLDADISTEVLSSIKYDNGYDNLLARAARLALLAGNSFLYQAWDPYKGELHPDWKKLQEKEQKITLPDGTEIDKPIYQGDIEFRLRTIMNTFLSPCDEAQDVEWVLLLDYIHVEKLKKDFGVEIEADDKATYFNPNTLVEQKLENHCAVFTFYHRSNRFLPEGLYFQATRKQVLKAPVKNPIPYLPRAELGNLPIRWLRDTEIEGELYAYPTASYMAPGQNLYDKIFTLCVKNIFFASHFKWMATQGSVDRLDLTNDSVICWVKPGHEKPTGQPFQAFGADVFNFLKYVKEDLETIAGVFSVSRGAPPPGTRSAASLYFYDEQQSQRGEGAKRKLTEFLIDSDKLTLAIISENYKDHDARLLKIMGPSRQWMVKRFKVDSLKKSTDIRVENSPNLPDSRYARIEILLQAKQRAPQVISDEALADAFDFGNDQKYITPTRQARLAAQAENLAFMAGEEVPSPEKWDDQIVHWQEHLKEMQNPSFREWPKDRQTAFKLHLETHERMMDEFATLESPTFAQELLTLPQFPVLYKRPPALPMTTPAPGSPPGALPSESGAAPSPGPGIPEGPPGQPTSGMPPEMLGAQPPT